jgi:hypothetical protein
MTLVLVHPREMALLILAPAGSSGRAQLATALLAEGEESDEGKEVDDL